MASGPTASEPAARGPATFDASGDRPDPPADDKAAVALTSPDAQRPGDTWSTENGRAGEAGVPAHDAPPETHSTAGGGMGSGAAGGSTAGGARSSGSTGTAGSASTGSDTAASNTGGGGSARRADTAGTRVDMRPGGVEDEAPEERHDPGAAAIVAGLDDEVVVVDEQPRYHVTGCRALVARPVIPLPVREAVELGFTPCGWCGPDRTLSGRHSAAAR
ncbi:MAG: hypothetical protein LH603_01415 [Pseudonocardia sp.]|nr:hypothetical protein [Pseudonocardia sp.]